MTKYRARKTGGFDSKKEFERFMVLKDREKKGKISNLETQKPFLLIDKNPFFRSVKYIADFVYTENGQQVIEDVKGYRRGQAYQLFKIKQKLMYEKYKILVKEI
ncbi:MAG: hypothetical protein A2Y41_07220 [Spirochaetes bacterium GWB1_36_13]|nr:MAG: hypothetical protein A2Y41_07220 [Spirochaetes bacterium GWB1_36_13]